MKTIEQLVAVYKEGLNFRIEENLNSTKKAATWLSEDLNKDTKDLSEKDLKELNSSIRFHKKWLKDNQNEMINLQIQSISDNKIIEHINKIIEENKKFYIDEEKTIEAIYKMFLELIYKNTVNKNEAKLETKTYDLSTIKWAKKEIKEAEEKIKLLQENIKRSKNRISEAKNNLKNNQIKYEKYGNQWEIIEQEFNNKYESNFDEAKKIVKEYQEVNNEQM